MERDLAEYEAEDVGETLVDKGASAKVLSLVEEVCESPLGDLTLMAINKRGIGGGDSKFADGESLADRG